jgi:SRSO17 transposase
MQRLLNAADWDADVVRDDLRGYVIEHLGAVDGVAVVDETGFVKKGGKSAGVARQYSGTAGRIENCQIGVFLAYAAPAGRTLVDRELYLPKAWAADLPRRREAGIPDEVGFATKPELAARMLIRAAAGGLPFDWVTADEVYGHDSKFRAVCEDLGLSYVLAVPVNEHVWVDTPAGPQQRRVDELAGELPTGKYQRLSTGDGAKGPRRYDWARLPIDPGSPGKWLLVRRSITDPSDMAYYRCHAAPGTTLRQLVRVAGTRWAVEESFQTGKGEVGLDQYQVRRYDAWYRHITLAMLAHAFLTVTRAATQAKKGVCHQPAS